MKSNRSFTAECLQKTLIAPFVYELRLEKPSGFCFEPGQFVLFDVPLLDDATNIQPRAYSVASTPSESDLRFVIKLVPNGRASRWIEQVVEAGTVIRLQGPFGNFRLDPASEKSYLFFATGTGIAPLRSQILWALQEQKDVRPIHLLFGFLKHEDRFWEEELRTLEEVHPNFHVHLSFLSGEKDWHGETGSLQTRLSQLLKDVSLPSIYICGAPVTVKELKEQCLTLGVSKSDVHFESYI